MAAKLEKTRHPGIYRRGARYVVRYTDGDGKTRQESARTLDDARTLKARRIAEVDAGEHQPASRIKFSEYATDWVGRYQGRGSRGFRESTRDDYRRDLNRYVIPYFNGKVRRTVEQISPTDVAGFVAWLCDQDAQGKRVADEKRQKSAERDGVDAKTVKVKTEPVYLADATVRRILSPLRACLSTALAEGLIRHNPTTGIALPARDEQRAIDSGSDHDQDEVKALTTDQLETFLRVAPVRWRTFFECLAVSGIRVSEAFALRWRDLELDGSNPNLKVRRAYVRGRFGPPKSKYGKRTIPLSPSMVDRFRQRRKETEWPGDNDLVFPAENGQPHHQENVRRRALKPTAEEAGVPWAGFHTFRHSCATRLFAEGRNAVQVQRWLGHHSPAFTLQVYVHLMDDDLGGALEIAKEPRDSQSECSPSIRAELPNQRLGFVR
ncbi:MAG TPA: site-specific integrase [Solirubrobacterales bacterium]|nr:site-specific integrase [Solirubrobacterales bacterium]